MIRFAPILTVGIWLACLVAASGQTPPPDDVAKTMDSARANGWRLAQISIQNLEAGKSDDFPGIACWLKDLDRATKGIDLKVSSDKWPAIDTDALVDHNPNFWRAYYEIAPGDPGLAMLHGGLLLTAGEATRASHLAAVALQRPGIPKPVQQGLEYLIASAQSYGAKSNDLVTRGTKLHDKEDYEGALKEYRAALALWPQNGWAHYEVGYTLREQKMVQAGQKKLPPNTIVENGPQNAPEVEAAFARSRKYDPLQWKAYQGSDPEALKALFPLAKKGMPAWQKLIKNVKQKQKDEVLEDLAAALQEAGIHDLALATRQILVARRKTYAPADHPFITTSLRKLAPGKQTEQILKRLATGVLELRQIIPPESN